MTMPTNVGAMWIPDGVEPDTHAAFRGTFSLAATAVIDVEVLGSSWWDLTIDGRWVEEGQPRYHASRPEHVAIRIELPAGAHVVALHAHHAGVHTRMMRVLPPFVRCRIVLDGTDVAIGWRARRLAGYRAQTARINPQLAWCDWLDSRTDPPAWRDAVAIAGDDDASWLAPIPAQVPDAPSRAARIRLGGRETITVRAMAGGELAEAFGYELDDPPARFLLRELDGTLPPQGLWRRYDLGRVRLGRPRFTLDCPAGAVVEMALAESLRGGRVGPHITLSAGRSCNLDHIVARGGVQVFEPSMAKGGRYLELHVLAPLASVRIVAEEFVERGYFAAPSGSFSCGDAVLDAAWRLGVETLRACAEDAITDNPTRERGQWTGDAVVALETAAVAFGDLALCRRALEQAAQDARADGMISGLSPADALGLPAYAMLWVGACVRHHELSGDRGLLEELLPAARRNLAALRAGENEHGLGDGLGWSFIDWGYARPAGPIDLALNLHYLSALRAMATWCSRLGENAEADRHVADAQRVLGLITRQLEPLLSASGWSGAGYQVAVLAVLYDAVEGDRRRAAAAFIVEHMRSCFPNDPAAPRLSDPGVSERRLITPYFAHFALAALASCGEIDIVLDQLRRCWGWMMAQGATTCLEVFDTRWSHCHQWSACPTWQLSRYVLGLRHCCHLGRNHLRLDLRPGSLRAASGRLPVDGGHVDIAWTRETGGIAYRLRASCPITVLHQDAPVSVVGEWTVLLSV